MTASALRRFAAIGLLVSASALRAAEPALLAKARAYVAAEAALNGITSVHYTGELVTTNQADPTKQTRAKVELIFSKPNQQRIMMTSDTIVETTALDGYDGWTRAVDPTNKNRPRLTLLGPEQIKRLRANAWENLAFYRGIEAVGGRVEEQGTQTIEGTTCQKVAFIHDPGIVFIRYFDVATGRLVLTETESGGTIREQGELVVNGIRFPRSIITTTKNARGESQTVTITFDQITVNETFPPATFAIPSFKELL